MRKITHVFEVIDEAALNAALPLNLEYIGLRSVAVASGDALAEPRIPSPQGAQRVTYVYEITNEAEFAKIHPLTLELAGARVVGYTGHDLMEVGRAAGDIVSSVETIRQAILAIAKP